MSKFESAASLRAHKADLLAASLSTLCVIHCLGLPLLAAVLPVFTGWAEAEWVHKVFVLLALPISASVILRRARIANSTGLVSAAIAGLVLLLAGAFVGALHDIERPITVVGSLLLASAHLRWWVRHRSCSLS